MLPSPRSTGAEHRQTIAHGVSRKDHKSSQEWKSTWGGQFPGLICWDFASFCDCCGSKEAGGLPQETQEDAKGDPLICPDSTFAIINDNGVHREESA